LHEKLLRALKNGNGLRSGGSEWHPRRDAAQFEHAMTHVSVLCQMGRSSRPAAAGNHLIERAAIAKLRIEFTAKFTRPAGPGVKAANDGMVDVFHERAAPGEGETDSP
jgi:hypothetical protein